MTDKLTTLSVAEASAALQSGKISSVELTKAYLANIEKHDKNLGCYLSLCADSALAQAKNADEQLKNKTALTALTGIPVALKDLFITKGIETTCASKILKDYIPPFDSTVAKKLADSGAVMLGKLNMDEFAMGSTNENSAYKHVANPWNVEHIPGGSSGASAAAVAADLCAASMGTDTGGSIRQPASMCGTVGIKPTYGRISRFGIIAFASSLDQAGPLTKTVKDAALMLQAVSGKDPQDATSLDVNTPNFAEKIGHDIKGMTLGLPKEYFIDGISSEIAQAVKDACEVYASLGAKVEEISLPHTKYAVPTYYIIAPAEASANLARYDGIRYGKRTANPKDLNALYEETRSQGFGPEVTLRIIMGTYVLSSGYYDDYYIRAQKTRTLIKQDFDQAFEKVDAIITPATPTAAFPLGDKSEDPIRMYLNDVFTIPTSLAGLPALSLPCGFTNGDLPIGLQLIGKSLDETTLLQVAHAYEQATPWHKRKPCL